MNRDQALEYSSALFTRFSSRTFTGEMLKESHVEILQNLKPELLGLDSLRVSLVHKPQGLDHVFKGVVGSYGKTTGVSAILAILVPAGAGWRGKMECGYVGEQYVLKATALGIGSCWNGGMFDFKKLMGILPIGPNDEIASLVALGIPKEKTDPLGRITKLFLPRKRLEEIASPEGLANNDWMCKAAEAVRLAPSAINRQPWHLHSDAGRITLEGIKTGGLVPIDLGIAMLHFRAAALAEGVDGRWEVKSEKRAVFVY